MENFGKVGAYKLDLSAILENPPLRDPTRHIYTNRNLDMAKIEAIGFDMDYTLAQYHQSAMNELSIRKTIEKLIENYQYPREIEEAKLDHDFIIRGLVVDKQSGHIFKPDQYRRVGRCYHGYQPVSEEVRRRLYGNKPITINSDRFARVDTLFSLPETTLLAGIVEHYQGLQRPLPYPIDQIFTHIRQSIDLAHRDNSLKAEILSNLKQYLIPSPELGLALHKLRSAGKKLFLLTNSEDYYTQAVMSFLLNDALSFLPTWQDYFDVVIVSGNKPSFFTNHHPFVHLDPKHGPREESVRLKPQEIYANGNLQDLERMMNLTGDAILYIGDHMYSDIVRSKRSAWWHTALVIQELNDYLRLTHEQLPTLQRIHDLDRETCQLNDESNYQQTLTRSLEKIQPLLVGLEPSEAALIEQKRKLAMREAQEKKARLADRLSEMEALEHEVEVRFNPYWGRIFRERHEPSLFGAQVQSYADIYTSQVDNFLFYSPDQHFRAPRDRMPHEPGDSTSAHPRG